MQIFTSAELELIAFVLPLLDASQRVSAATLARAGLLSHPDLGSNAMPRDGGTTYEFDPDELRDACNTIDTEYGHLSHSFR
jgi:hypothetical protein